MLIMIINIIYIKYFSNQKIMSLFGFSCLKVISGSMEPEIKIGDNIIIKKCKNYEEGDIITFISNDEIITHRISSIIDDNYYTKGDANNCNDLEPIKINQIFGKVVFHFNSIMNNSFLTKSKYLYIKNNSMYFYIAKPFFTIEGEDAIEMNDNLEVAEYKFYIKNYNNEQINEVDLDYKISVCTDSKIEYTILSNNLKVDEETTYTLGYNNFAINEHKLSLKIQNGYSGILKINIYAKQRNTNSMENITYAKYVLNKTKEVRIFNKN